MIIRHKQRQTVPSARPLRARLQLSQAILCLLAAGWILASAAAAQTANENRWEAAIQTFEARDRQQPPPQDGILFVGSSSIVRWDLAEYFPHLPVINRGFGGSQVADSLHFADRIILPYKPRTVVLYAGDNDIAAGKTAAQVLADYQALVKRIHEALPQTRIVFIAIKPSIRRWELVDEMRKANRMIREVTATDQQLEYVDIDQPMLGIDGRPRKELFAADGLHLNAKGYALWSQLVRPYLKTDPAKD